MSPPDADQETDIVVAILQSHFVNETHHLPPLHRAYVARELIDMLLVVAEEQMEQAAQRN